jgi:hypothetical protein
MQNTDGQTDGQMDQENYILLRTCEIRKLIFKEKRKRVGEQGLSL